jgi:hypothetical protein
MWFIKKTWPLRKQLLVGFLSCGSLLLLLQYLIVVFVGIVPGGSLTVSESEEALDAQLRGHLALTAEETGKAIERRFENVESTVVSPLAMALQRVHAGSTAVAPAHLDHRCAQLVQGVGGVNLVTSAAQPAGEDEARSCWYFSSDVPATNAAAALGAADTAVVARTALLDRWMARLLSIHRGTLESVYFGLAVDATAPGRAVWRRLPATKLGSVAGTLFSCSAPGAANAGRCYNPVVRSWWQSAIKEGKGSPAQQAGLGNSIITEPYRGASGAKPWMITIARAVYTADGATLVGVVGADMLIYQVQQLIDSVRILDTGYASLATSSGRVVADRDFSAATASAATEAPRVWGLGSGLGEAQFNAMLLPGAPPVTTYNHPVTGARMFVAHVAFEPTRSPFVIGDSAAQKKLPLGLSPGRWVILSRVPQAEARGTIAAMRSEVDASVSANMGWTALTTALTLLAFARIVVAQASHICRPVAAMTEAARSIVDNADGEDIFASVNTDRMRAADDEIGDLVTEFKAMVTGLSKKDEAAAATGLQDSESGFPANPFQ